MVEKNIIHVMKKYGGDGHQNHAGLVTVNLNLLEEYESNAYFTGDGKSKETEGTKFLKKSRFQILKEFLTSNPDLVIVHHYYGSFFLLFLQMLLHLFDIPVIIRADMSYRRFYAGSFIKRRVRNFLFTIEGLLAYRLWDTLEYKKEIATNFLPIPPEKFSVIPKALPKALYEKPASQAITIGTEEKSNYILGVSAWWSDIKNLHTALEVFSEVVEETEEKDLEFWLVGGFYSGKYAKIDSETYRRTGEYETGREYRKRISNLIEELEIEERVKFLGYKKGEELQKIYRKAKVYYLPTKNDLGSFSFLESIASGTPIVTRNIPGVPSELMKDKVCGFLEDNKDNQKKAIIQLLSDDELYSRMQKNCLDIAKKYRWRIVNSKWKKVLRNI